MSTLATIIEGEADLADVLFLVAVILFAIVAVIRLTGRSLEASLMALGATALALGWLVL
jgi:Cu/Ag efflux pump CusA